MTPARPSGSARRPLAAKPVEPPACTTFMPLPEAQAAERFLDFAFTDAIPSRLRVRRPRIDTLGLRGMPRVDAMLQPPICETPRAGAQPAERFVHFAPFAEAIPARIPTQSPRIGESDGGRHSEAAARLRRYGRRFPRRRRPSDSWTHAICRRDPGPHPLAVTANRESGHGRHSEAAARLATRGRRFRSAGGRALPDGRIHDAIAHEYPGADAGDRESDHRRSFGLRHGVGPDRVREILAPLPGAQAAERFVEFACADAIPAAAIATQLPVSRVSRLPAFMSPASPLRSGRSSRKPSSRSFARCSIAVPPHTIALRRICHSQCTGDEAGSRRSSRTALQAAGPRAGSPADAGRKHAGRPGICASSYSSFGGHDAPSADRRCRGPSASAGARRVRSRRHGAGKHAGGRQAGSRGHRDPDRAAVAGVRAVPADRRSRRGSRSAGRRARAVSARVDAGDQPVGDAAVARGARRRGTRDSSSSCAPNSASRRCRCPRPAWPRRRAPMPQPANLDPISRIAAQPAGAQPERPLPAIPRPGLFPLEYYCQRIDQRPRQPHRADRRPPRPGAAAVRHPSLRSAASKTC